MDDEQESKLFQRIEWLDALNTDHPDIDEDHRQLIENTNTILAILSTEPPWNELPSLVRQMSDDCTAHFRREEQILQQEGFPGAEAHAAEHRRIEEHLAEIDADIQKVARPGGPCKSARELALFFRSLLVEHFLHYDLRYKSHLLFRSGR